MATVFVSTNMASTTGASRIFDCVADEVVENGMVGGIGDLAEGESVIYKFTKGTPAKKTYVIVDQPAWDADTSRITNQRLDKFTIPAKTPFRARVLRVNDEFAISKDGFTSESFAQVQVGAFAVVDSATGKFKAQASEPESGSYCKIMRKSVMGGTLATAAHDYGHMTELFELRVMY